MAAAAYRYESEDDCACSAGAGSDDGSDDGASCDGDGAGGGGKQKFLFYGLEKSDTMQRESIRQFQLAMQLIPVDDKSAYLEAKLRAPDLIAAESNPLKYVKFASFNPWSAAQRVAQYWQRRRSTFGERFLLPVLDFSGHGALRQEEMYIFDCGAVGFLPQDSSGRTVVFCDMSLADLKRTQGPPLQRAMFALLQIVAENEMSQKEPYRAIIQLNSLLAANFDSASAEIMSVLIREAFPLNRPKIHISVRKFNAASLKSSSVLENAACLALQQIGGFFSKTASINMFDSAQDSIMEMTKLGFLREGLPESLGGVLLREDLPFWQRQYGRAMLAADKPPPRPVDLQGLVNKTVAFYNAGKQQATAAQEEAEEQMRRGSLSLSQQQPYSSMLSSDSAAEALRQDSGLLTHIRNEQRRAGRLLSAGGSQPDLLTSLDSRKLAPGLSSYHDPGMAWSHTGQQHRAVAAAAASEIAMPSRVLPTVSSKELRMREENEIALGNAYDLKEQDVVCGPRGMQESKHPGNQRLRALAELGRESYQKATTKAEKSKIIDTIESAIREAGGRFVRQDLDGSGMWYAMNSRGSREKTGQALRAALAKQKRMNKQALKKKAKNAC